MNLVLDASVVVKWFSQDDPAEAHIDEAMALFYRVKQGKDHVLQPTHWKAEVLAVLARDRPKEVDVLAGVLDAMKLPVLDSLNVYQRAAHLSVKHKHHLFDTLYHAVALETGAEFITADKKYARKAVGEGAMVLLGEVRL
ncbi:MAG: type II toxin-antitoxin system VapC family toxin [Candidatus Hydrogenedentes bacterium]|nr:type II toxin-antitoxin system VapC family toxin [Candidatus Hydrogenedentota bacterium]